MGARREARECAMQLLYQWGGSGAASESLSPESTFETFWKNRPADSDNDVRDFAEKLFLETVERLEQIDTLIEVHSENWKVERIAAIDRDILRIAICELLAAQSDAPPAVVIDEALEIAKKFSAEDSAEFINGILDSVRKAVEKEPRR